MDGIRRVFLGALLLLALGAGAGSASAAACAGSGEAPCPYSAASAFGQRAEGVLRFPEAVAVDTQGDVYVADQLSFVVQKFSAAGAFEGQWGSYGGGHGQFGPIGGIATDAAGDVYVVDSEHDRIEKFDANGNFLLAWGRAGSGLGQFHFGSSQDFTKPPGGGIAISGDYVYVADSGNNRIQRFNPQGGEAMAWGSKGSAPGQFIYPRGVAANAEEVVVADNDNHRLELFTPEGAYVNEVGTAGAGVGQFSFPYGIALDAAGNIYVADDTNHRVAKLSSLLQFLGVWGGFGSKPGQLAFPRAIASDPAGDTYVADTANDRIEVYNPEGAYLRTIGISARGPGELTAPRGVAVDPTGRVLVSDTVGNRVESFATDGAFLGQWTFAGPGVRGFRAPASLAVDPKGPVFVADRGNERVVRLWGDGTPLQELGGPSALGGAQMSGAFSVAVSPANEETYVADAAHNRILVYGPEGKLRAKWGANGGDGTAGSGRGAFDHPQAVAIDAAGDAYVADTANNRIVELSPTGETIGEWGQRGTANGRFRSPTGIAVDAEGNVYVVDSENNRIQVFSREGHFLAKWGNRGIGLGQFSFPTAIAIGCEGAAYVADTLGNRIERFQLSSSAGGGCEATGTWPPPLDVAPVLSVKLPRATGILARRGLALSVSCQRGCRVLVTATLTPISGRHRRAVKLLASARALPVTLAGHVRLRVSAHALSTLRRELGRRREMTARVTIVAEGPTGRRTTLRRGYLVRR
ncbi:MAG TPA: SMP-30/gluconolactonase/LRE family protein [Solirubrobacteraceae bacterium]|jgi:DNA-binding beta-propeller fold protein YncE